MGTKKHLAGAVADICESLGNGPILDVFAGMGAVCESLADRRNVWVNDCQPFASTVSRVLFTSQWPPQPIAETQAILEKPFERNMQALSSRFSKYINKEKRFLRTGKLEDALAGNTNLPHVGSCAELDLIRKRLARKPGTFPYRMATITYIGAYFGVQQCFEIDSLRYAIDTARKDGFISRESEQWMLLALCQVASKINNSTGQFAQYIKPKPGNINRVLEKRRRSVYREFIATLDRLGPIGSDLWRRGNRAFRSDALALLPRLTRQQRAPAIVYADPPYTNAEYPRYYHVLDMLLEYRYPPASGVGRYPDRRNRPIFARVRTVTNAMRRLIEQSAKLGSSLVLSYPASGILHSNDITVVELLREHYRNVRVAHSENHSHSTFGGPNAKPKVRVTEFVYAATAPR